MPLFTIMFGVILMMIGIVTYTSALPDADGNTPISLLLPTLLGLLALTLGVGSVFKKDLKKHLMHAAVLLASLGVIVPIIQLFSFLATLWSEERNKALSLLGVILTVIISGFYVFTAVQTFRAARRAREEKPSQYALSPDHDQPAKPAETEPIEAESEPTQTDPPASA